MKTDELTAFQEEAKRKQALYEATVLPNMRRVRDHYSQKHGLTPVDRGNQTR